MISSVNDPSDSISLSLTNQVCHVLGVTPLLVVSQSSKTSLQHFLGSSLCLFLINLTVEILYPRAYATSSHSDETLRIKYRFRSRISGFESKEKKNVAANRTENLMSQIKIVS